MCVCVCVCVCFSLISTLINEITYIAIKRIISRYKDEWTDILQYAEILKFPTFVFQEL